MTAKGIGGGLHPAVFFLCLAGCFSMIIWTPTVLSVLYMHVFWYFCICTCSAQLSMFHMERRSRNTITIIITIIISVCLLVGCLFALCPSNMLVYHINRSAHTSVHAATLKQKLLIKLSISPSHSMLTPGQPVPALTL